ncbi:3-keto-5-aminohexanoate cleavage protein [Haliangium sp.]|uniref:3-keto-5-aminohexanoate cleavage protein n=1 Tax=Haliangium sp. TaxID=2663208 RepID=UPI003D0C5CE7
MSSLHDKVIISCALTGAVTTKRHCPAIPYTPVEIAEEAQRAYDAGAAIVHIHARTDAGAPTWDVDVFERIKAEVEARCPVLINFSTGGAGPMQSRVAHIALAPAIAALNMGSMNYAKWSRRKGDFAFKFVFENSFDDIVSFARAMAEAGVKPEMECFDTGHVASHTVLAKLGLIAAPYHFSFIMGVLGGIPATARHLAFQAANVPTDARWKVIGISREQWPLCMSALGLGGDIRVGLEDNFYLPSGDMATSNGALVEAAAGMVRLSGREVASVADTRQILWPNHDGKEAPAPAQEPA